ncbi:MAG: LysR substrate-binding domain-containing protein, partial [Burkholderiaceae bacterium]
SSKQVRLTPAGAAFLIEAQQILAQTTQARELVGRIAAGAIGRLRKGFVASMLYRGLPQRLAAFQRARPGIELVLRELNSGEQIDALRSGRLDAGFAHAPTLPDGLHGLDYLAEPFVCCLPRSHPQAGAAAADLAALATETFVLFAREVSPDYYEQIIGLCMQAGFTPSVRHEVRHWLTVVALVAAGIGVALVPAALARAGMAGVSFVPLAAKQRRFRSMTRMLWSPARSSPALEALIATIRIGLREGPAARPQPSVAGTVSTPASASARGGRRAPRRTRSP